ncbi:unnamed protein product [Chironomus riparius]|uniref:Fatty acid hydroxylase domain-containing protein n=1 Tax=Chironomus riparius TaxID=315576 RepID=A0A9N9S3X2_9DIPT|nr:unnamed protein product [Chironomus riparius]
MQKLFRTVPIYFWFFTIWSISKVIQFIFNEEQTVWELIWKKSTGFCDNDEFKLFVYGILFASSIASVSVVSIYSYFDFSQKPAFIRKYKVNPHTNEPPDFRQFMKALMYSSITGITFLVPNLIFTYYGLQWRGMPALYPLPDIFTVLISCFMNDHIVDIGTYIAHRTLHHKLLYKHIHKKHHEYKSTIAVAVIYSHPIEHIFSHLLPLAFGMIIIRCHIATAWISIMAFMISSTINHSGYHLPFLNSPEYHDFHHVKFDSNYSGFGLMDWIFGTDKLYKNSIHRQRDRLLVSLKSAHELYPKEKNEKNGKML